MKQCDEVSHSVEDLGATNSIDKAMMSSSMDTCCSIHTGWMGCSPFQKICGSEVDRFSYETIPLRHPTATVHVGSDSKRRLRCMLLLLYWEYLNKVDMWFSRKSSKRSRKTVKAKTFSSSQQRGKQSSSFCRLLDVVDHKKLSVHVDLSSRATRQIKPGDMGGGQWLSSTALAKRFMGCVCVVRFCQNW